MIRMKVSENDSHDRLFRHLSFKILISFWICFTFSFDHVRSYSYSKEVSTNNSSWALPHLLKGLANLLGHFAALQSIDDDHPVVTLQHNHWYDRLDDDDTNNDDDLQHDAVRQAVADRHIHILTHFQDLKNILILWKDKYWIFLWCKNPERLSPPSCWILCCGLTVWTLHPSPPSTDSTQRLKSNISKPFCDIPAWFSSAWLVHDGVAISELQQWRVLLETQNLSCLSYFVSINWMVRWSMVQWFDGK